jgi:hypothetical protein
MDVLQAGGEVEARKKAQRARRKRGDKEFAAAAAVPAEQDGFPPTQVRLDIDAPCPLFASHGASIRLPADAGRGADAQDPAAGALVPPPRDDDDHTRNSGLTDICLHFE